MRIVPREAGMMVHCYSGALVRVRCYAGSEVGCQINIGTLRPTRPVRYAKVCKLRLKLCLSEYRVSYAVEWWMMKHE